MEKTLSASLMWVLGMELVWWRNVDSGMNW